MPDFRFLNGDCDKDTIRINTAAKNRRPPSKRTPNYMLGCLVWTLAIGSCSYLVSTMKQPTERGLARPVAAPVVEARRPRPDDYAPPPLGESPEEYFGQLYRDLIDFRSDPRFSEVGFGAGGRFATWQAVVKENGLRETPATTAAWGQGWLNKWSKKENESGAGFCPMPGDLLVLGLKAYRELNWPYDEMSAVWHKKYGR
jgi:hypothetical protein